jgi:hypothetical protein
MRSEWTDIEVARLRRGIARGETPAEIAADMPGRTPKAVARKRDKLGKAGDAPARVAANEPGPAETRTIEGDRMTIELKRTRVSSEAELLEACNVDRTVWEVERLTVNTWDMGSKDAAGNVQVVPLYQVKAVLKRRKLAIAIREEIDAMIAEAREHAPAYPVQIRQASSGGFLLEVSIPDAHFGKLAWHEECGENYDTSIAERLYLEAVDVIISRTAGMAFERVVYVVGNDLINADNSENTTARGTVQTTDGRHYRTFRIARRVVVAATEKLRAVAPVDIVMVAGNHDKDNTFYLGEVLDAWFSNCEDVTVNNAPTQRKVYEFGRVALMFTHGSEEKHIDLPLLMAQENPEVWGRTRFREIHLGHLHQRRAMHFLGTQEKMGVTVRILPSLCAPEDWHVSKAFVGNQRSAEAYVWSRDEGLVGYHVYTVPAGSGEKARRAA